MTRAEDLLRETFASREPMAGDGAALMPGVLARHGRRRRRTAFTAAVTLVAAITATAGGIAALRTDHRHEEPAVPKGWRIESSQGAEIIVPNSWTINEEGCLRETARPTVVRGPFVSAKCLVPDPPGKSVATLGSWGLSDRDIQRLTPHPFTVNGVNGWRTVTRLPDGRWSGQVMIPSRGERPGQELGLAVTTPDAALGKRILDSFRLVKVDSNGCATRNSEMPYPPNRSPAYKGPVMPPTVTSIAVCYYGQRPEFRWDTQPSEPLLQADVLLTGRTAATVVRQINASPWSWDHSCPAGSGAGAPVAVLVGRDSAGRKSYVWLSSNACGDGLVGARHGIVSDHLAHLILDPVFGKGGWYGSV